MRLVLALSDQMQGHACGKEGGGEGQSHQMQVPDRGGRKQHIFYTTYIPHDIGGGRRALMLMHEGAGGWCHQRGREGGAIRGGDRGGGAIRGGGGVVPSEGGRGGCHQRGGGGAAIRGFGRACKVLLLG